MLPAPPEHERTFRALQLFLRQTVGFRLAIVLYNDPVARAQMIQRLITEPPPPRQIVRLDLHQAGKDARLLTCVQQAFSQADGAAAVMVEELESRSQYTPELGSNPQADFLAQANLDRELFATTCPGPVVLWVTPLLERAFMDQAPDLWHWRSHVFDLCTRMLPTANEAISQGEKSWSIHPELRLEALETELAAYRKTGSVHDELRTLNSIGIARLNAGQARLALLDFAEVLRLAREIGDRGGEGAALGNLGLAHADLGDARQAISFYEQRLVIAREIEDRRGEGNALGNLGLAHAALGDARQAISCYEQQLVIAREMGNRRGEGNALGNLGIAHKNLGDARQAISFYEQALVITREIGDRRGEGNALGNLGNAHADLGDAWQAISFHEQALVISREIGDRRGEGNALGSLGNAHAALGDARQAISFYEQCLVLHREIGDRRGEGIDLWNSARQFWKLGERAEAIRRAEAALQIFEAIEDPNAAMVRARLAEWREG